MENIKEYLEAQIKLSNELSSILKSMESLEDKEKEELYNQNKELLEKLDSVNEDNVNLTGDRIVEFQKKINKLLRNREFQKDSQFYGQLKRLDEEASILSKKIDYLNKRLQTNYDKFKEKHKSEIWTNVENTKKISGAEVNSSSRKDEGCSIKENGADSSNQMKTTILNNESVNANQEKNIASDDKGINAEQEGITATDDKSVNADQGRTIAASKSDNSNQGRITINESQKIDQEAKLQQKRADSKEIKDKKMEFNVGTNILNIIGVILILIAFITFGKYIYTYFMSNTVKGIFLFVISSLVLASGEFVLKKRLPRFSEGISALGVAGLYASVIINYLVLETIGSTLALVISVIITGISLWISYVNNSDVIRVLSLIGGYICLYPMKYLYGISSYITIAILLMINIANICIPIKNRRFLIYTSFINIFLCNAFLLSRMLEKNASSIFLLGVLIVNSFMYAKSYKEDDEILYGASFFTSLIFILLVFLTGDLAWRLASLGVSVVFYLLVKNQLKETHFMQAGIIATLLLFRYSMYLIFIDNILFCAIMILNVMYAKNKKDSYLKAYTFIYCALGVIYFYLGHSFECILYILSFGFIIWYMGDKFNNKKYIIFAKNFLLGITLIKVIAREIVNFDYVWLLGTAVCIAFLLITNNVSRLKDDKIKKSNQIIMILAFVMCNVQRSHSILILLLILAVGAGIIYWFMDGEYVLENSITKYKLLSYSLYTTYAIIRLFTIETYNSTLYNVVLSIILMITALINVWFGFKRENLPLRRYGLILSLIVCAKLIIVDFSSVDFVMKTFLFLIVGIIALVISYIYNKLENEHKSKKE